MSRAALAAQINAWGKRWPYAGYGLPEAPAGVPAVTFPSTKLGIRVELYLGGGAEGFETVQRQVPMTGDWSRSTVRVHSGTFSLKSAAIGDSATSDQVITVPRYSTEVSFWYYVSSEGGFDFLRVLRNGAQMLADSGESGWVQASFGVVEGDTLTFRYEKDSSATGGDDAAYIDDLVFTGSWVDVSPYVLYRSRIRITRGRQNEQSTAPPSTCNLTFKNGDRRFSPRNVNGPYFGLLKRNTKMRVWLNPGSGDSLRFTGEIPDWSPKWITSLARTVAVQASGLLRRLEQGEAAFRSAIVRATLLAAQDGQHGALRHYWPLEDGRDATVALNAVAGQPPMALTSAVDTAAFDWEEPGGAFTNPRNVHYGTELVPSFADGGIATAQFPATSGSSWAVQVACYTNPSGSTPMAEWKTSGITWRLMTSGALAPFLTANGSTVVTCSHLMFSGDVTVTAAQNGTNIDVSIERGYGETPDAGSFVGFLAGITQFKLNPDNTTEANGVYSLSHVRIWDGVAAPTPSHTNPTATTGPGSAWHAYDAELATDRFARFCTEEGIDHEIGELVVEQQIMGKQEALDRLTLLRQCEDASVGVIDETFSGALRLSSRTFRYLQEPALIADYGNDDVFDIDPTDDDLLSRNEWNISRDTGSFVRAVLDDGSAMSISEPPIGIGRGYDDAKELKLFGDTQLGDQAYWRLRAGTIDEVRYKSITIAMHRSPHLAPAWLACDVGSRMQVLNPPQDVGPDTIDQTIEGYTEGFDQFTWEVSVNGSPYSANRVYLLDGALGRMDCKAATLAEQLDTTETGVDLSIGDACVWAHDTGDYVITVGGEDMLVTVVGAASGSIGAYTQTLTVQRSYNGAVMTHNVGERVHVKYPIIPAMGE